MPRIEIGIEPLEPLLFGDNRSARTGESHLLGDQDPSPVTVFGAVGTRILAALGARGRGDWSRVEAVLGPFLKDLDQSGPDSAQLVGFALRDAAGKPWFPAPLHLRVRRGEAAGSRFFGVRPARPADPSGGILSSVATDRKLEAPPARDESDEELFVDEGLLAELLTGSDVSDRPLSSSTRKRDQLFASEPRLGLAIDNHRGTAVPGVLFARPYRRFAGQVDEQGRWSGAGFVAWMDFPGTGGRKPESFDGVGFLGGDRRRAWFSFSGLDGAPLERIKAGVAARLERSRGFLVYLLTPLPVDGELPVFPWQGKPVAAAVGRSRPMSGWNVQADAPGPRKIRTLVPAGSVYFFEWPAAEAQSLEARQQLLDRHWLQPIDERYRNAGFGRMLIGAWE